MDCRVVLAQTNPRLGDLHANLEAHVEQVRALAGTCDLVLFPELSLTGYFLRDQVYELGLELDSPELARLCELSRDVSIAVGFVERTSSGRLYNALALLEGGEPVGVHRKVHLVSYGLFDEERDFAAGDGLRLFESRHGRFGPLLCEDLWHASSAYVHYLADADALLVASASPARGVEAPGPGLGSQRSWDLLLRATALQTRTWVLYAARVGWEDGVGFGGGSCVVDPFGEVAASLPALEPGELAARITSAELHRARFETPLRRDERPEVVHAALARLLRADGGDEAEAAAER